MLSSARTVMSISVLRVSLFASLLLSVSPLKAQSAFVGEFIYEDHNQVDPRPIKLSSIHGFAQNSSNAVLAKLPIGLFTERGHRLVASVVTNDKGEYVFPQVPPGRYRMVARLPGFCTANVPVRISGGLLRWQESVELHMIPPGIDQCSFAKPNWF